MRYRTPLLVGLSMVIIAVGMISFYILSSSRPQEIILTAREFGYNNFSGGPVLKIKAGENVRIFLENRGGVAHEFMVVTDKDGFTRELKRVASELYSPSISIEELERDPRLEMVHHRYAAASLLIDGKLMHHLVVKPQESAYFLLVINRPGLYYYICPRFAATYPDIHADRGMIGVIMVEP
ncbi:MAG: cupredoxin domain-containing protein [Candidatus Caldarchaeum sp.]